MRSPRVPTATFPTSIEPTAVGAWGVAAVLAAAALAVAAAGCGPRRPAVVPASGIVTLDGQPLPGGFVRLVPAASRPATGAIGPDGRFTLGTFTVADGCVPGTHGVEVIGPLPPGGETAAAVPAPTVTVPARYRDAKTSGLTITITGPTRDLTISLSGEK